LPYKVVLTAAAAEDFRRLDGSLKEPVAKQLRKLETAPRLGEHLGNRAGLDLTGYYKLYVAKKAIRIVYRILEQEILVEVVAIGKREDLAVYQEALKCLQRRPR
jgi:mRNA interferase RelE/StbE